MLFAKNIIEQCYFKLKPKGHQHIITIGKAIKKIISIPDFILFEYRDADIVKFTEKYYCMCNGNIESLPIEIDFKDGVYTNEIFISLYKQNLLYKEIKGTAKKINDRYFTIFKKDGSKTVLTEEYKNRFQSIID